MSPQLQKQISVLSISEIEGFQSWIERRLRKDPLSLKEREHLRNLNLEIDAHLRLVREKL